MHADIHEGTKRRDVAHHTLELHARFQIRDLRHPLKEVRHHEFRTRIAARFLEFREDVLHGRESELIRNKVSRPETLQHRFIPDQLFNRKTGFFRNRVGD